MKKNYISLIFSIICASPQAQCVATYPIILADKEALLADADTLLTNDEPITYNIICPTKEIILYPNPTTDLITIKNLDKIYTKGVILGIDGRIHLNVNPTIDINVSELANGIWFLKILDLNVIFKFVKI